MKLATTIRSQVRSHATRGLLRSLPTFKVVMDMPEHLKSLLENLDAAELQPSEGRRR